jgi:predicted transcriptional regulator YdeE
MLNITIKKSPNIRIIGMKKEISFAENNYQIDNRPFFEILSEKYKRDAEDSEEEVWIPIKGSE